MSERLPIYVFRGKYRPGGDDTLVCAAPLDLVVATYGGGGLKGEGGLAAAFGGAAFFRNGETGHSYLGVWGARNASRFRSTLRRGGATLDIVQEPPPARLIWLSTGDTRPLTVSSPFA